jgi:hypothetical protein
MNEVGECSKCKLATEEAGKEGGERADSLDQVRKLLTSRVGIQRSARKVGSKIGSLRPITGVPQHKPLALHTLRGVQPQETDTAPL